MDRFSEQELLKKYREGKCTEEELSWIEAWYADWHMKDRAVLSESDLNSAEVLMRDAVMLRIGTKQHTLWLRYAGVAAAVALIVLGVYFFSTPHLSDSALSSRVSRDLNDIAPGKNTATITLANGKTIALSDQKTGVVIDAAKITYNDGTAILSSGAAAKDLDPSELGMTRTMAMLTASTPRGGTYRITLPDGSKVWLNAASKIRFPSQFSGKQRKIILDGEAYFEIARDKVHPFIVETDKQQVEVLGTHFNVNAYKEEGNVKTTLLEGSVKVTAGQNKQILKPGYQAINSGSTIKVAEVNIENITDWKNGDFYLDRIDFKSAMRKIERWYNVEVIYDASVPDNMETGGWISRNKSLSQVLDFIESSGLVKFKLQGRKVYVSR